MKKRKYMTSEDKARILAEAKQDGCVLTDLAKKYNVNCQTQLKFDTDFLNTQSKNIPVHIYL